MLKKYSYIAEGKAKACFLKGDLITFRTGTLKDRDAEIVSQLNDLYELQFLGEYGEATGKTIQMLAERLETEAIQSGRWHVYRTMIGRPSTPTA